MKIIKSLLLIFLTISSATLLNIQKRHHRHKHDNKHLDGAKHKHKNVYIYNKHYHVNQPTLSQIHNNPNIQSLYNSHDSIHHDTPNTHYIPKVHWVEDDLHTHTQVLNHDDHIHTMTQSYPNDHYHQQLTDASRLFAPHIGIIII